MAFRAVVSIPKRTIPIPVFTSPLTKKDCLNFTNNPYAKKKSRKFIYSEFARHSEKNLKIVKQIHPQTYKLFQGTTELDPIKQDNTETKEQEKIDTSALQLAPKLYKYGSSLRVGAIGIKQGMTTYFDAYTGKAEAATIIYLDTNTTMDCRSLPTLSKTKAIQDTSAGIRENPLSALKPFRYYCMKCRIPIKRFRQSFIVSKDAILPPATPITSAHFIAGQYVDIRAKSKGKGTQGVVKRWGFKGMPASHGTSLTHRKGGSIGSSHTIGKVFKGTKMAGRMGFDYAIAWRLPVLKVDTQNNCIWVKGAVPGANKRELRISDSLGNKIFQFVPPPFPTHIPSVDEDCPKEQFPDPKYYGRGVFHTKGASDKSIIR